MILDCLLPDGTSPSDINYLFPGDCCQTIKCVLSLTPGETFREVHRIEWTDPNGSFIVSVNGLPYSNPLPTHFTITDDPDTNIEIELKICGNYFSNPAPFGGRLTITCQNPNYVETTDFNFDYYDATTATCYPTPQAFTGGIFAWLCRDGDCSEVNADPIIIQNCASTYLEVDIFDPGIAGLTFYLNGDLSTPYTIDPILGSATIQVPPNSTSEISFTFCPTPSPGSFTFQIQICRLDYAIPVNYSTVTCESCEISCYDVLLKTEANYIFDSGGFCDFNTSSIYTKAAIGEKKILRFELVYDLGFTGNDIDVYFNPWLYDVVCNVASKYGSGLIDDPPPAGWHFKFQPVYVGAGAIPMTLYGAGINANTQRNYSATIEFFTPAAGDPKLFAIELTFFLIEDLDNWVDTGVIANQWKLLNSHVLAPNPIENLVQSVYTVDKRICGLVYIVDPVHPVEVPGSGNPNVTPPVPPDLVPYECGLVKSIPITARYYNRGLYDGPSEYTNPVFTLKRNSVTVPDFSTLLKTEVSFKINDMPGGSGITNVVLWLIDGSKANNFDTILGNYDASRTEVYSIPGVSVLDNHFQSPSVSPTPIGGGVYESKLYVDTNLDPNGVYYLIAVVYGFTDQMVNSFISDPIYVTEIPGIEICCPLDINSDWADFIRYDGAYSENCFSPTMKERIRNTLEITAGTFQTCLDDYGFTGSFLDVLTSIRLNVYRREDSFPAPGSRTFFYFDSFNSIRTPGFPGNWNNTSPGFTVSDDGIGTISTVYEGRVRYEDTLPVSGGSVYTALNATPFDRIPAGGLGSVYASTLGITYDWADKDIWFEYVFTFDLSAFFGQPCVVNQVHLNRIHPIDFETTPNPFNSLLKPLVIRGFDGTNLVDIDGPFCDGTYEYLEVEVASNGNINMRGYLIAFLDPFPYGVNGLLEDDGGVVSPSGFVSLDASPIYDVPNYFNTIDTFKIDLSLLPPGKYQICGLFLDDPNFVPNP
jgi:hypothetical protein